jgi:hypothetical protein
MKRSERKKMLNKTLRKNMKLSSFMVAMIIFLMNFVTIFVIILPDVAEAAAGDAWQRVNGYNYYSSCNPSAEDALNGTGTWTCLTPETHELIIDLGQFYLIRKVSGRSNTANDPTSVNIYISDDPASWGDAVESAITTWQNTTTMVEVDITDTHGRYIKIEVDSTEDANRLGFGSAGDPFNIFDAYGEEYATEDNVDPDGVIGDLPPQWTPVGFGNPEDLVKDDNDGSYFETSSENSLLGFNHESISVSSGATITNVRLVARMKADVANDRVVMGIRLGVTTYPSGVTDLTTSWADYEVEFNENPQNGMPWTTSDVDSSQSVIRAEHIRAGIPANKLYCSEVWFFVEYIYSNFTSSEATPDNDETVTFNGSLSQGDVNWTWDFENDGTPDAYGETATHSFPLAGIYSVNLTITNDDSDSDYYVDSSYTVKQNISLVTGANNGKNYITWGATSSILASELAGASYANLQEGDTILVHNSSSGSWQDFKYLHPAGPDFTINRWDHVYIQCTNAKSFSVTPDAAVQSQNRTLIRDTNNVNGYNYITWSGSSSIKASEFATDSDLDLTNQPISVYNHTTGSWKGYTEIPSLPQGVKDGMDFYINPYDVICLKISSGTNGSYYDSDNY